MGDKDKVQYMYDNIDGLDELKLRPYVRRNGNVRQTNKAYLGPGMKIFNDSGSEMKNQTQAFKQVDWSWTLNYVINEVGNGGTRSKSPNRKRVKCQKAKFICNQPQDYLRWAQDKIASNRISPAKKDFLFEPPAGKGLMGRGLRGGGIAPRRKARTYNLADIEGSGSASDLKYKRIGTKFIRKADLNNALKLVFPNRTIVGPIRAMSDELAATVKDLLYNDNISQLAYRDLSIEDQTVFYEIVKQTHVEHTLQTPIEDPRLTLKAEFDKLRGEISLGNNNPDMLRELYCLVADMFEQKMLSNKEFRTNANIAELNKILSELTIDDPIVQKAKQNPSPDWIHGKKASATVWANEPKERKVKTFKL
ncbi:unnamed protein product [Phytophthora fragariaefolia]|uniref:Unnamed protein product n=1 Tax=Phytophthora fragariaefolia TaxID=1490495 RepID=A0A9W7CSZ5_9STRA|nr:unnamed protein product [Phytophthora fragariaefolia]